MIFIPENFFSIQNLKTGNVKVGRQITIVPPLYFTTNKKIHEEVK